jgi:hypothetical protein
MRIRVSESIAIPSITRGADGSVILSINTELSFEDIEGFLPTRRTRHRILIVGR